MQQPSNVHEFPSTAELSKLLECPVCTEIPLPPINQCVQGHILCQVCRPKVPNCPQCRSAFSSNRCFIIEGIVNNSKFDCKYKEHGCKQRVRGEAFKNHIGTCDFRNGPIAVAATSSSYCYSWKRISIGGDSVPANAFQVSLQGGYPSFIGRFDMGTNGTYPTLLDYPQYAKKWEHSQHQLEVLIAAPGILHWKTVINGAVPKNAVACGREPVQSASDVIWYVGKTMDRKYIGWVRAKTNTNNNGLTFYGSQRFEKNSEFQVLIKTDLCLALERSLIIK